MAHSIRNSNDHGICSAESTAEARQQQLSELPKISKSLAPVSGRQGDGSARDNVAPCCIFEFIDYRTKSQPAAPAIQYENNLALSYQDLQQLSNSIAHNLIIRPRTIVPICMDVSVELVATILAVLKSGAAYVVLDPKGSAERNNAIVKDVEADFVIVDQIYSSAFVQSVVINTTPSNKPKATRLGRESGNVNPEDPAYVIYTSGKCSKKGLGLILIVSRHNRYSERGHYYSCFRFLWSSVLFPAP